MSEHNEIQRIKVQRNNALADMERFMNEAETMRAAIEKIYYAAHWTPDRPCSADKLWTDLRDAAGLPPGRSPRPPGPALASGEGK